MATGRQRCSHCDEIIGVYEPVVILDRDGATTVTSLAATPDAACLGRLLHAGCHAEHAGPPQRRAK